MNKTPSLFEPETPPQPLAELRLEPGDAALVEVSDAFFYENRRELDFILTRRLEGYRVQRVDRAVIAMLITATMVTVTAIGLMSMLNAALLAGGLHLLRFDQCLGRINAGHHDVIAAVEEIVRDLRRV